MFKRIGLSLLLVATTFFGAILVMVTLGSWGRGSKEKSATKIVEGGMTVEVSNANESSDKDHADSINTALDKLG